MLLLLIKWDYRFWLLRDITISNCFGIAAGFSIQVNNFRG